jgi:hypothetical protein
MDGSGNGCENVPRFEILPTQLVQGKAADAADSSASFPVGPRPQNALRRCRSPRQCRRHEYRPNDIRGHWRSDSVEICLDPANGAEHTMGCYKIGVFPWDSSGWCAPRVMLTLSKDRLRKRAGHAIASSRNADGYPIQAAIPFSEIGLKSGQSRSVQHHVYDGDKADSAPGENHQQIAHCVGATFRCAGTPGRLGPNRPGVIAGLDYFSRLRRMHSRFDRHHEGPSYMKLAFPAGLRGNAVSFVERFRTSLSAEVARKHVMMVNQRASTSTRRRMGPA